ncbi:MAG: DUF2142 domain-containing protein [bacterium]|nr:DUF2142 domain-containing protein [bacterium]
MRRFSLESALLLLIVLTYLVVAGLYAIRTPDWQTPDEPAHYNYIRQVAEEGQIPVIEQDDWDRAYLNTLTGSRFAPELLDDLDEIEYEDHQPPLYYVLAAPVFAVTGGDLTALRLFSVLIGLVIVISAYGIGRALYPDRPGVGLGAAAFVAFLPQHVVFLASANNDALGWAIVAVALWATVGYLKQPLDAPNTRFMIQAWHLGLIVGIGLITKATTYFLAGVIPVAIILHHLSPPPTPPQRFREGRRGGVLRELALFLLPALILGGAWWLRNLDVYGVPDFLGLRAHDAVVADQPRTADYIAQFGWDDYLRKAAQDTVQSFISQAGWMALPLPAPYYIVFLGGVVFALSGWAVRAMHLPDDSLTPYLEEDEHSSERQRQLHAWIVLTLTMLLAALAYVYYNTEFLQLQGRYTYPLLIPLGLVLALGVDAWRRALLPRPRLNPRQVLRLFRRRQVRRALQPQEGTAVEEPEEEDASTGWWLTPLFFYSLAALDVWLLWRVIVSNLS